MMRPHRTLTLVFCLLLSTLGPLAADTIEGDIRDITGDAPLRTPVKFTPLSFPSAEGEAVVAGPPRTIVPRADGKFTNEFAGGNYRVTIGTYTFDIAVPGDGTTNSLADLASSGLTTYTYTNPVPYRVAVSTGLAASTNGITVTITNTRPALSNMSETASAVTSSTNVWIGGAAVVTNGLTVGAGGGSYTSSFNQGPFGQFNVTAFDGTFEGSGFVFDDALTVKEDFNVTTDDGNADADFVLGGGTFTVSAANAQVTGPLTVGNTLTAEAAVRVGTDLTVTGAVSAASATFSGGTTNNGVGFHGNGAGLTNLGAANIAAGGVLPSLVGSNLTRLPAQRVYNILNYGAIPDDGSSDGDHFAIQYCLDLCYTNGGGIVYVPEGTYHLTNQTYWPDLESENADSLLVVRGDNTTIMGDGAGSIITAMPYTNATKMNMIGSGDFYDVPWLGASDVVIRDLTINPNYPFADYISDTTQIYRAGRWSFINVNFFNTFSDCIDVGSSHLTVQSCYASNIAASFVQIGTTSGNGQTYVTNPVAMISDCVIVDGRMKSSFFEGVSGWFLLDNTSVVFTREITPVLDFPSVTGWLMGGSQLYALVNNCKFQSPTNNTYPAVLLTSISDAKFTACKFGAREGGAVIPTAEAGWFTNNGKLAVFDSYFDSKRVLDAANTSAGTYTHFERNRVYQDGAVNHIALYGAIGVRIVGNVFKGGGGTITAIQSATHNGVYCENESGAAGAALLDFNAAATNWLIAGNITRGYGGVDSLGQSGFTRNVIRDNTFSPGIASSLSFRIGGGTNVIERNQVGTFHFQDHTCVSNLIRDNVLTEWAYVTATSATRDSNTLSGNRLFQTYATTP